MREGNAEGSLQRPKKPRWYVTQIKQVDIERWRVGLLCGPCPGDYFATHSLERRKAYFLSSCAIQVPMKNSYVLFAKPYLW